MGRLAQLHGRSPLSVADSKVDSGEQRPFENQYSDAMRRTRASRFAVEDTAAIESLGAALSDPANLEKDRTLARLGSLFERVDAFDPLASDPTAADDLGPKADIFQGVWPEAAKLRATGALLELGKRITCPTVAIHGDYDPHPAEGVKKPLDAFLSDFRFVLLKDCGHKPWIERSAKDTFFAVLGEELLRPGVNN